MMRALRAFAVAATLVIIACGGSTTSNLSPTIAVNQSGTTLSVAGVPARAISTLAYIDQHHRAPDGFVGGSTYENDGRGGGQTLARKDAHGASITYLEWDVNRHKSGVNRGAERLITGGDGSAYYTNDHYQTFRRIR